MTPFYNTVLEIQYNLSEFKRCECTHIQSAVISTSVCTVLTCDMSSSGIVQFAKLSYFLCIRVGDIVHCYDSKTFDCSVLTM